MQVTREAQETIIAANQAVKKAMNHYGDCYIVTKMSNSLRDALTKTVTFSGVGPVWSEGRLEWAFANDYIDVHVVVSRITPEKVMASIREQYGNSSFVLDDDAPPVYEWSTHSHDAISKPSSKTKF